MNYFWEWVTLSDNIVHLIWIYTRSNNFAKNCLFFVYVWVKIQFNLFHSMRKSKCKKNLVLVQIQNQHTFQNRLSWILTQAYTEKWHFNKVISICFIGFIIFRISTAHNISNIQFSNSVSKHFGQFFCFFSQFDLFLPFFNGVFYGIQSITSISLVWYTQFSCRRIFRQNVVKSEKNFCSKYLFSLLSRAVLTLMQHLMLKLWKFSLKTFFELSIKFTN